MSKQQPQNRQQAKHRQANAGSFQKGDPRINRGGLPAEARAFHEAFKRALCRELEKPTRFDPEGKETRFERGAARLAELFEAGVPWAVSEVLDRLVGRPSQESKVELSGADGGLIEHTIRFANGKKPDES